MALKRIRPIAMTSSFAMAVTTLSLALPARAADGKAYPSTMCQPSSGEAAPFFSGTATIDPNSGHFVNCPIVRETIGTGGIAAASIVVRDLSPVEDVECTLLSLRSDNTLVASSFRKSAGSSNAVQTLSFGALTSASNGNYTINCRIPKRNGAAFSSIVAYRVDEN